MSEHRTIHKSPEEPRSSNERGDEGSLLTFALEWRKEP